ncbi:hypothetical protein TCDM_10757 [Trypanosoma cruzi Dm28c]|uniref:Uncharacterized protein n=1 Tax=Trypanosoma cruzi Dm28c TaxID=1416333 RepID=V5BB86_TRYCR|nr:hypothetical protein TCDM_10757 [Trypanosoma cruzi Dm28c]
MCAPPHRPSSHAHTSRLPQRAVRREAHRAVVMSASVGVRAEQLGGNTRHPSQEECSNKQLKEGRVEKKKRPY